MSSILSWNGQGLGAAPAVSRRSGQNRGSNPMYLVPLIEKHPGTKFVLFHGGYPWTREIGGLLHNYPNVYADLVWLPLISPTAAVQALHEWIETAVTSEKITWGGDCWTPEETFERY